MVELIKNSIMQFEENPIASTILRAIFDLTKKQLECFLKLRTTKNSGTCILNLVEQMNSERSIIQKHLKILHKKGLVKRKSVSLADFNELCIQNKRIDMKTKTNKGYLYLYYAITDQELLEKTSRTLKDWNKILQLYLDTN